MSRRTLTVPSAVVATGLLALAPACNNYGPDADEAGFDGETSIDGGDSNSDEGSSSGDSTDDGEGSSESSGTDSGAPMPSGFGQPIAGGGTVDGFTTMTINIGDDEYKVQTNPWGGAEQVITVGGGKVFTIDSIVHPGGGNPWDVASYPSVYKGTAYGGEPTANSGMPIAVSEISHVFTGMMSNAVGMGYAGNSTYDVYFTNAENYSGGSPDTYLMVWFDGKSLNPINGPGEGWSCGGAPPTFVESCSAAGSTNIGGKTFHRFIGPNGNATVISYVPETTMGVWEFDLNDFIQDAVAEGVVTPSMYLQSVQGGFELADAGTGLTIEDFYIDVF